MSSAEGLSDPEQESRAAERGLSISLTEPPANGWLRGHYGLRGAAQWLRKGCLIPARGSEIRIQLPSSDNGANFRARI